MFSNCIHKNADGKCNYSELLFCASDIWSNNCLQAFNSEEVICMNFYDPNAEEVKFGLDNQAKT